MDGSDACSREDPHGSRRFQKVLGGSRRFQKVPEGSRRFQKVPDYPLVKNNLFQYFKFEPQCSAESSVDANANHRRRQEMALVAGRLETVN